MKLAQPDSSLQLSLFSIPPSFVISSNAQARNYYGAIAQEIVCKAMHCMPIKIDGRCDVCFDAFLQTDAINGSFVEIKSVRSKGKLVIYKWRLEKELEVAKTSSHNVEYFVLVHNVKGARNADEYFICFPMVEFAFINFLLNFSQKKSNQQRFLLTQLKLNKKRKESVTIEKVIERDIIMFLLYKSSSI